MRSLPAGRSAPSSSPAFVPCVALYDHLSSRLLFTFLFDMLLSFLLLLAQLDNQPVNSMLPFSRTNLTQRIMH